jgi:citrate lyase subunit beta / citryl-CoA lyase
MRPLVALRSLLFVPGDDQRKLMKAAKAPADALVIDWEDAVAPGRKAVARSHTMAFLASREIFASVVLVRVNPIHSLGFAADIAHVRQVHAEGLVLSKVVSAKDVQYAEEQLNGSGSRQGVWLFPMIESAAGLLNASAIVNSSERVAALIFGAEDFCADTGITRGREEIELLYARSAIVAAARAANRQVIDSPCLVFNDDREVAKAALRARNLGFTGKLAIHPRQLRILNKSFSPRPEEIREAQRILAAVAASGEGVTAVDGTMVDEAVVKRARQILEMAKLPCPM